MLELHRRLLCRAALCPEGVGQTDSGPQGREQEASGEYKATTHHYQIDLNSSAFV